MCIKRIQNGDMIGYTAECSICRRKYKNGRTFKRIRDIKISVANSIWLSDTIRISYMADAYRWKIFHNKETESAVAICGRCKSFH